MFWRPKPGSMRSTCHPILTPVWKSTKDQRLEWRKMPSMAFTSNHLVRFECFRLFSTTMGFSVNHIVLTSFKHICLFRYYINLIELFMWQGPRASRRCPAAPWAKKGSIYELPAQRSSYLWHTCLRYQCWRHQVSDIFSFFYFSSWLNWWMHNIDCAKSARICSTLVFLLTALSQPPWFLLQPGACQPRGNPWEIRPQWPGERSSNHRFHISEIWPKWLLRWFDILRCVGMNATCTEPEAEGNETRIRQVGICCLQDHKQLVSKKILLVSISSKVKT